METEDNFNHISLLAGLGSIVFFGAAIVPITAIVFGILAILVKKPHTPYSLGGIILGTFFLILHIGFQHGLFWFGN